MKNSDLLLQEIKQDKLLQKYLYKYTWLSGSSTIVYPIMLYDNKIWSEITLQLDTDKNVFNKLIERYINNFNFIEKIIFCKSDGSCPSRLIFKINN